MRKKQHNNVKKWNKIHTMMKTMIAMTMTYEIMFIDIEQLLDTI